MNLFNRRRAMMAAVSALKKFIVAAASGIVSFVTNVVHTTKVVCEFAPVQSGTGDPSPSNVRSISGWNGCEITHTGKNLINCQIESKTQSGLTSSNNSNGTIHLQGTTSGARFYTNIANKFILKPGTYVLSKTVSTNFGKITIQVQGLNSGGSIVSRYTLPNQNTEYWFPITDPADKYNVFIDVTDMETNVSVNADIAIQLEVGQTASSYEQFKGTTLPINWNLPDEYQEVEYIESSGTQYINMFPDDPSPLPSDNLAIKLDVTVTGKVANQEAGIFGGKPASPSAINSPTLFLPKTTMVLSSWCNNRSEFSSGVTLSIGTNYSIESVWNAGSGRTITIDGTPHSSETNNNSSMANDVARHFCLFKDGIRATDSSYASLKVSSFEMTVDSVLIRKLVPCYRKSDDEIGMFDLVTGTFFTNAGTGTFTKGSNVSTLPTYYGGTVTLNEDGSADLVVIDGYIASYNGEMLSNHYISSQAAPNTTPVTGSQVFDFGADTEIYHFSSIGALESFIGTNTVWHDMNGSITVEYYKNT